MWCERCNATQGNFLPSIRSSSSKDDDDDDQVMWNITSYALTEPCHVEGWPCEVFCASNNKRLITISINLTHLFHLSRLIILTSFVFDSIPTTIQKAIPKFSTPSPSHNAFVRMHKRSYGNMTVIFLIQFVFNAWLKLKTKRDQLIVHGMRQILNASISTH